MRAVIIGAGIGGLCAGISLKRAGLDVQVYEQAPELKPVGAGLSLWANAIRALDLLGLGDAFRAAAVPNSGSIRTWKGDVLSRLSIQQLEAELGEAVWGIHRADLHTLLLDALGEDVIQLESVCSGVVQAGEFAAAHFVDGRSAQGDVLIGADGIRSIVRIGLFPEAKPHYGGYAVWRGVASFSHPALPIGEAFEAWGCGQRFGLLHLLGGRVYWFATANAPEGSQDQDRRSELLTRFSGWGEPVGALIEATSEADIVRHDMYDIEPLRQWGSGRVTLLGDAAHAMMPDLGQGACQAIEDAVVLGQSFGRHVDPVMALRDYEARRIDRTRHISLRSRFAGTMGQWSNPFLCMMRNTIARLTPDRIAIRQYAAIVNVDFSMSAYERKNRD